MSFIDHNCECGHPVLMHGPMFRSSERVCHCGCPSAQPAESVLIETMRIDGERTPLVHPGARVPWSPPQQVACDCERCVALYEQMEAAS